jgi:uncharacterized membrane protein YfcA
VHDLFTMAALDVLIVSFGIGIVVGLTGMGGGALMTPALIFLGINPSAAVANDLVSSAITKSVGAATHWKQGSPNLRLAGYLVMGSIPMGFLGTFIPRWIDGNPETFLKYALGIALLFAAASYTFRMYLQLRLVTSGNAASVENPTLRPIPTILIGAIGGLMVGITSVGAGSVIMIALLLLYPTLSAIRLVGTDLVQAVPLVIAAAAGQWINHGVQWDVLLPLIIGGAPGTYVGSRMAGWVSQSVIRRGIVIVLSLSGLKMLGVSPTWVGIIGAGMLLLGPLAWGFVRQTRGIPAFDNNSGAWRLTERER